MSFTKDCVVNSGEINTAFWTNAAFWAGDNLVDIYTGKKFEVWPCQFDALASNADRKCYRFPRRGGKTTMLVTEALWYAFTGGGFEDKNLDILVLFPSKSGMTLFFRKMNQIINQSRQNLDANHGIHGVNIGDNYGRILRYGKDNHKPLRITFYGWYLGENDSSGYGVKGATPDVLMIDEAAYVNNQFLKEVINPMIYFNFKMKVILASTPNWSDNNFFEKCCKNSEYFKEFHFSSLDRPDWEEIGDRIEECFGNDKEKWNMEMLAEFKCEPTVSELLFIGRELQEKLDKIEEEKDDSAWIRDGKRGLYLL